MPDATGGKKLSETVRCQSTSEIPFRPSRRTLYGIGRIVSYYEDVYDIQLWDRKSKKTAKWNKALRPVKVEDEPATELVQSNRVRR
jgi:endonuclease I